MKSALIRHSRQPINQFWHYVLRQMIQKLRHRIDSFLQAGQPATTTPPSPCAIDGGSSTKYERSCRWISFWIAASKVDFCTSGLRNGVRRKVAKYTHLATVRGTMLVRAKRRSGSEVRQ